jgi:hypothetical protein
MNAATTTSRAATKKGLPRAPKNDATTVAKQAQTEKARKAASKTALKESLTKHTTPTVVIPDRRAPQMPTDEQVKARHAAEHEAYLAALRVDAAALGVDADAYIAEQLTRTSTPYTGPMIALKTARKSYIKAANGIECNGDQLAVICGMYAREIVVAGLMKVLGLKQNPYPHLNPGQQSMNLRNKARHQIKEGTVLMTDIAAELAAISLAIKAE